jgi:hypothetical protein
MAVAVRSCWRCVRAKPRYRLWRRSTRRIPCERRLSTPARSAYCAVNCGVSWRCRAAWSASWWTGGRTVSWRGAAWAEVHALRVGHARQVPRSGSGTRRERARIGAEGRQHRVPAMGRCPGPEKRRGRGEGRGAGDGEVWSGRVRRGAVDWVRVEYTKAARTWRLRVWRG